MIRLNSWDQDAEHVRFSLQLPSSVSSKATNIQCASLFVKVNCSPFFYCLDLYDYVDEEQSAASIEGHTVHFKLLKKSNGVWPSLKFEGASKEELAKRREASLAEVKEREERKLEERKKMKAATADVVFHKQWDLDKEHRRAIEHGKAQDKAIAEEELYEWQDHLNDKKTAPAVAAVINNNSSNAVAATTATSTDDDNDDDDDDYDDIDEEVEEENISNKNNSNNKAQLDPTIEKSQSLYRKMRESGITTMEELESVESNKSKKTGTITTTSNNSNNSSNNKNGSIFDDLPAPRNHTKVQLSFTPKPTNLPARERIEEDEETLKGSGAPVHAAASASVQNAVWLKERGDGFFGKRSFAAAINAYTSALQLDPKHVGCFSNRAACHLHQQNYTLAISDATRAIELLEKQKGDVDIEQDIVTQRALARAFAHRSAAHIRLGMFREGLRDLESAAKFAPEDKNIANDVANFAHIFTSSEYGNLKANGDQLFSSGNYSEAIECYNQAIALDDGCWQAYSNRAACYLSLNNFEKCIEDSSKTLMLLGASDEESTTKLALRVLARRGSAYCSLGHYQLGRNDLSLALKLDPSNAQLRQDLSLISATPSSSGNNYPFVM